MRKSGILLIVLVSLILTLSATTTQAQVSYDCSTVADDIFQGIILEWDPNPNGNTPGGVGISYVELKAGEKITFTVTQVSGGPTQMEFWPPFAGTHQIDIAPTTFSFIAQEDNVYDNFLVMVVYGSMGQVRVNWECENAPPDGHIHDGRINSGDLGTLTVVYPQETQIDVYAVNPETSEGWMVIRVIVEDLPPMDEVLTEPLLLGEATSPFTGKSIALYLLPSNEFVIAAENPDGTPYRFLWPRTE